MTVIFEEDELMHAGTPHVGATPHSGRYAWGSGDDPKQRAKDFLETYDKLKKGGCDSKDIFKYFGMDRGELEAMKVISKRELKAFQNAEIVKMREDGHSLQAIADKYGYKNPSSIQHIVDQKGFAKEEKARDAAKQLQKRVEEVSYLDIGEGTIQQLGLTTPMLKKATAYLKRDGYRVYKFDDEQMTTKYSTHAIVLTKKDVTFGELVNNKEKIKPFKDNLSKAEADKLGAPFEGIRIDPKRVKVRYPDEGGDLADGIIYVRPGVKDLSMGNRHFAQVRILVGDKHYLKGIAIERDDLPKGVDLLFNTSKSRKKNDLDVLKEVSEDPTHPFKASFRQIKDANGKVTSAMNIVNTDDDWDGWSKNLPSQFLAKQPTQLAKSQLDLQRMKKVAEFEKIKNLNNATVKRYLLNKFADEVDAETNHLKAAAMPGQKTHVILPLASIKEDQVYAPTYKDGTRLALVRFPHAGRFEIADVTVNNRNRDGKEMIGKAKAALGMNPKVAQKLSGADFDGDTVIAIPNNAGRVKSEPLLPQLKDFDPHTQYAGYEGMKIMGERSKQKQMGVVSNLIADMTNQGAPMSDIAKAVKHSMVVIDAPKHKLDYKQSEIDNDIKRLKETYQKQPDGRSGGASSLLTRANSESIVPRQMQRTSIDPTTGKKIHYTAEAHRYYVDKDGKKHERVTRTTKMQTTDDARTLMSVHPSKMEMIYADHANALKKLANDARLEYINTKTPRVDPVAKREYAKEVASLKEKLATSQANKPYERQAQRLAASSIALMRKDNPDMSKDDIKKLKSKELDRARKAVGSFKDKDKRTEKLIQIEPREWEAIQKRAVSASDLTAILKVGDVEQIKQLAMPRVDKALTSRQVSRMNSMIKRGLTQAEVAEALGISVSTVNKYT